MNLFIGNLNPETTASTLRPLFSEFGEVVSAKVIIDNATGMSRGFGFVEMADKFHAMDAIDNIDATFLEGNIISVKEAKQSNTGGGGRQGAGGNRSGSFRPRTPRPGGYNSDRPSYSSRPGSYNSDRPGSYNSDRPNYNSDRPNYNSDKPNYNSDRPNYNKDRFNSL